MIGINSTNLVSESRCLLRTGTDTARLTQEHLNRDIHLRGDSQDMVD